MIRCTKCKEPAKKVVLDDYEHEEGLVLHNVKAMECPKCKEFVFTEEQMEEVEKKTKALAVHRFTFERKLTISGRSLVINIPEDLVKHLHLVKGALVKLVPLDDKRFLVEVS